MILDHVIRWLIVIAAAVIDIILGSIICLGLFALPLYLVAIVFNLAAGIVIGWGL